MYKSAMKCNKTLGKWCKNKHGASKIIDTLETYQLPPPTPVDRRHYSTKTMSTEESRLQLSSLLGRVWQPLPQDDKGKEDLGAIKGGEATP
jgi:hypothetical protein